MVTDLLGIGGLEKVVVTIATQLSERGHTVAVAAAPGGELWDELPDEVIRHAAPPRETLWQRLRYFTWLSRLVRSGDFDVVHAHQRGVALLARCARTGTRVRVVEHVHNAFRPDRTRFASFRGDHLIACGQAIARMLITDFQRSPSRVTVVTNAVADWGAGGPPELPSVRGADFPTILVAARATPQKDPGRFIEVIAHLNRVEHRVDGLWVGDGELLEECRREVARRGIPGLEFTGARTDIAARMRDADLVVLTSRWEGLPLVLLEAASMGRVLVAPRVGSCAEVVEDGVNGVLFDVDSSAATIARLIHEVLDRDTLTRMGAASRATYLRHFGIDSQVQKVEAVYQHVLER
jgi:glycosyltransferase involved in cell wall biosynthesis